MKLIFIPYTIIPQQILKKLTPQERYKIIDKLTEEIKLKAFLPNRESLHFCCEKIPEIW